MRSSDWFWSKWFWGVGSGSGNRSTWSGESFLSRPRRKSAKFLNFREKKKFKKERLSSGKNGLWTNCLTYTPWGVESPPRKNPFLQASTIFSLGSESTRILLINKITYWFLPSSRTASVLAGKYWTSFSLLNSRARLSPQFPPPLFRLSSFPPLSS